MVGFVAAHIAWNGVSNQKPHWWSIALRSELVLQSASTLRKICLREYSLTVDAIKSLLESRSKVGLALNRWISRNRLAIMSAITYYTDRKWTFWIVQVTVDVINNLFLTCFESLIWIIGPGSTYWNKASYTYEASSCSVWAYWQQQTLNANW